MAIVIFERTEEQNQEEKRWLCGFLLVFPAIFVTFLQMMHLSEVFL